MTRRAPPAVPEDVLDVARRVASIIRRVTGGQDYRVLLFGSWAAGRAVEQSDIDIGILGPSELDPAAMVEIREACEALPTLRAVDLVDLAGAPATLRRVAVTEGFEVPPA
ncbi:MAG TPA: nucleotidyltransferase domain-containing protein [Candidatus Tectomicrobia bacterium]|nr:nucleotidyltransferase domain-containing protein [Candidatus Tectomicrobia bacterium]